jgi:hypothetical protein
MFALYFFPSCVFLILTILLFLAIRNSATASFSSLIYFSIKLFSLDSFVKSNPSVICPKKNCGKKINSNT